METVYETGAEALGGPVEYPDSFGDESAVVRIHSGNGEHHEMDLGAIACFDLALIDVGLDRDERLRTVLHDYFTWATTNTMGRYHRCADDVPAGLAVLERSWDGPVGRAGRDDGRFEGREGRSQ